jgi:hypothetical protein
MSANFEISLPGLSETAYFLHAIGRKKEKSFDMLFVS